MTNVLENTNMETKEAGFMTRDELIKAREQDIRDAAEAYMEVTSNHGALDRMTETFVKRYARDSVDAKMDLRNLFRKSPAWNEELDALVINGNRTHEPDYDRVYHLEWDILREKYWSADPATEVDLDNVMEYFSNPTISDYKREECIASMERIAPKAYAEGKKPSRIFKAICVALGVADETAGSDFQRKFAELADELSSKTIDFKLFVSINPAHFFTMSNPHDDRRGETLISCHSLNSEYEWKNGCVGYGRDNTSIIAFTVADYTNPKDFYNRKTSRQIYAYEVGNGVLLQSRMYNTSGGTSGVQSETAVYRDLIEREISFCEDMPNLWKPYSATGEKSYLIRTGDGFGGYKDWQYDSFCPNVCIREDKLETCHPITVGTWGLCVVCGDECDEELLCDDCRDVHCCDYCGDAYEGEDMFWVWNEDGDYVQVCRDCLEEHYEFCAECEEYHWRDDMVETCDGEWICQNCADRHYVQCEDCGRYCREDEAYEIENPYGYNYYVCESCLEYGEYGYCEECGNYFALEDLVTVNYPDGSTVEMCEECATANGYQQCPECGEYYTELCEDGTCPACGCIIEERDEDEDSEESEVA